MSELFFRGSPADHLANLIRLLDLQKTRPLTGLESLDLDQAIKGLIHEFKPIARSAVKRLQGARGSGRNQLLKQHAPSLLAEAIWDFKGNSLGQLGNRVGQFVYFESIEWGNLHGDYPRYQYEQNREFDAKKQALSSKSRWRPTDDDVYDSLGWSPTVRKNHTARVTNEFLRSRVECERNTPVDVTDARYQWVAREIPRLPLGESKVLQLLFLSAPPLSVSETASKLGLSEFQVEEYRRSAVKRLKMRLELQPAARRLLKGDASAS